MTTKNTLNRYNDSFPINWRKGFTTGTIRPSSGGKEEPYNDKDLGWCLLCWDSEAKKHIVYQYKTDMFLEWNFKKDSYDPVK